MVGPALFLAVLSSTSSPREAAWSVAVMTTATAVAGPLVGARLDRSRHPRRTTALAMVWMALAVALIGVLAGRSGAVVVLAGCAGLAAPVVSGGWTAQLPGVVPPDRLTAATAWDAATYNVAGIVGPGLVALSGYLLGERSGMLIAAGMLVLATPLALAVPAPWATRGSIDAAAGLNPRPPGLLGDLRRGGRALFASGALRRVTVVTTVGYLGVGIAFVAAPLRGAEFGSASAGGALLACFAVGALAGTATMTRRSVASRPDRAVLAGTAALGVLLVVAAAMPTPGWTGAVLVLAGWAEGVAFTGMLAVRHREAPARFRGQVFTTAASLKIGAYALGVAGAGALTDDGAALLAAAGLAQLVAVGAGAAVSWSRPRPVADPAPARAGRRG